MTINGVQNKILELLNSQDIISLGEMKLALREYLKDERLLESLIKKSFDDLIKLDIVRVLEDGFWVLSKPLTSFSQTVTISGPVACAIAKVLNKAASFLSDEDVELCNALSITEEDIETITTIADNINKREESSDATGNDEFKLP